MKFKIATYLVSIVLLGCAPPPSPPPTIGVDFYGDRVVNGMNIQRVEELYGKPYRQEWSPTTTHEKHLVHYYIYQGPIGDGKYVYKELVVVFSNNLVIKHHYSEKTLLRLEKDSKASNDVIQLN